MKTGQVNNHLTPFQIWDGWQDPNFRPSHLYQTREWFEVLTKTWPGLKIKMLMVNETTAAPLFIQRRGPLCLVGSPLRGFFTPYGGLMGTGDPANLPDYMHGDFCEISLPPGWTARNYWQKQKTILLDLSPGLDKIWLKMDGTTRRQIRQGERRGAVIREETGSSWIKPFYNLVHGTYARQHLPPPAPLAFYQNIAHHLMPAHAKVLMIYSEGVAIAGSIIGWDNNTVYGIDRGADRNYQHLRPSNLTDWAIIQWAIEAGLKCFDMVGGNIPGIAQYKMGFGGNEVEYPSLTWTPTLLGGLAWGGYQKLRAPIKQFYTWKAFKQ